MTIRFNDYFRTLELPTDASAEDIRFRYRQLVRVYHPDRYNDPDDKEFVEAMMKRINEAYHALTRSPRPPLEQPAKTVAQPTVYQTVKGIPAGMTIMLASIAFVLGAITVQFFNFMPFSDAYGSTTQPDRGVAIAQANSDPMTALVRVTATATPPPTTTETTETVEVLADTISTSQTPIQEQLVLASNSMSGVFPLQSKNKNQTPKNQTTENQTTEIETKSLSPTDSVLPTHTVAPTNTSVPTNTPTARPTDTAVPTDTPEPTQTSEPTATATQPSPTDTPIPAPTFNTQPTANTQSTDGGIRLTITVDYNVFARSTTSIQSDPVALIRIGEQIFVIGRTIDNYWLRIVLADGRQGWVYTETVGMDYSIVATLPVVNS